MVRDLPVVILGAGGFIGANLTRRLLELGARVTAVDIEYPDYRHDAIDGAQIRIHNLLEPDEAQAAIAGAKVVFHLAADMGGVGYFHSDADLDASMANGRITLNVLQAATRTRVERLFYASSACAYPIELQMRPGCAPLLAEPMLGFGTPDALYGAEKLHGLRLCSKLPFARVGVLHTIYGPLQEHSGRRMKFPAAAATKAIAARETGRLELWGDGQQLRSYLFVDDAVERILTLTLSDRYDGPVNIGATGAVTCEQIARLCLQIAGARDAVIAYNPAQPSGVLARDCSPAKWERLYGPAPQIGYTEGFGRFLAWLDTMS